MMIWPFTKRKPKPTYTIEYIGHDLNPFLPDGWRVSGIDRKLEIDGIDVLKHTETRFTNGTVMRETKWLVGLEPRKMSRILSILSSAHDRLKASRYAKDLEDYKKVSLNIAKLNKND